jgi:hypothetical protein
MRHTVCWPNTEIHTTKVPAKFLQHHLYPKDNIDTPVGRHFRQNDHKGLMDVEIHVLDFIHPGTKIHIGPAIKK